LIFISGAGIKNTSQWHQAVENRCVFSTCLKALSDTSSDRSAGGRQFRVAGPFTAKLRCPVAVWTLGTSRVPVTADRSSVVTQSLCDFLFVVNSHISYHFQDLVLKTLDIFYSPQFVICRFKFGLQNVQSLGYPSVKAACCFTLFVFFYYIRFYYWCFSSQTSI